MQIRFRAAHLPRRTMPPGGAGPLPPRFRPNPISIREEGTVDALGDVDLELVLLTKQDRRCGDEIAVQIDHRPGAFTTSTRHRSEMLEAGFISAQAVRDPCPR